MLNDFSRQTKKQIQHCFKIFKASTDIFHHQVAKVGAQSIEHQSTIHVFENLTVQIVRLGICFGFTDDKNS